MFKKLWIIIPLIFVVNACKKGKTVITPDNGEPVELLERLQSLPDVEVREVNPLYGYPRAFEIDVTQPVDHNNPDGQKFTQRIYLHHVDETAPMILRTQGYTSSLRRVIELAGMFTANHISVTHRYFENARPEPLDWQYLNIEQAAADHHHIVELFRQIYPDKWLNTGISKGGMTALFHKRFYPNDVDATVAYVAPLPTALPDLRFDEFLEEVGDEDCRQKIKDFQRLVLENRDSLVTYFNDYVSYSGLDFSMGYNAALEYTVLDYQFAFWQYGPSDCSIIPDSSASSEEIFDYLNRESIFYYYSDQGKWFGEPLYYQAMTEFGYYDFMKDHLQDLLLTDPSFQSLAPENVSMTYNPDVMQDIIQWLQSEGNNIIYIYGGNDPWTAGAIEHTGSTNAIRIVQSGEDHGVKISDLDNQQLVIDALEEWLEVEVSIFQQNIYIDQESENDELVLTKPRL